MLTLTTSHECQGAVGYANLTAIAGPGITYAYTLTRASDGVEVENSFVSRNQLPLDFEGLYDDEYLLRLEDVGDASNFGTARFTLTCGYPNPGGGGGSTCDLVVSKVEAHVPTAAGGFGYVTIYYSTAATGRVLFNVVGPVVAGSNYLLASSGDLYNLLPGTYDYLLRLEDNPDCQVSGSFTIEPAAVVPDPSLSDPARWEPVGGVLPNPVLLKVEAELTDALGAPRLGLHVELELWRPAALAAFASFKATIRAATQYVDAAPYLRAELVAAQRYAATSSRPLIDQDAALRFTYRYRVVDSAGAEPWLTRAGERYAVLAALPGAADTMAPFVADGSGRVASLFPDEEATQFVGYPLEVSVLLPPSTATRYAECRYLSATRQQLEIRAFTLAPSLPAGVLRIPLPNNPLPLAAFVEVAIVDTDRSSAGATPATGYLLTNTGRLRL